MLELLAIDRDELCKVGVCSVVGGVCGEAKVCESIVRSACFVAVGQSAGRCVASSDDEVMELGVGCNVVGE